MLQLKGKSRLFVYMLIFTIAYTLIQFDLIRLYIIIELSTTIDFHYFQKIKVIYTVVKSQWETKLFCFIYTSTLPWYIYGRYCSNSF